MVVILRSDEVDGARFGVNLISPYQGRWTTFGNLVPRVGGRQPGIDQVRATVERLLAPAR